MCVRVYVFVFIYMREMFLFYLYLEIMDVARYGSGFVVVVYQRNGWKILLNYPICEVRDN